MPVKFVAQFLSLRCVIPRLKKDFGLNITYHKIVYERKDCEDFD